MTKKYFRIMLGKGHRFAQECYQSCWFGGGWGFDDSLENELPENWKEFNKVKIPVYLEKYPNSSKVAAGLACGMLWTICKGIKLNDIVLCPNGEGSYWVGKVISDYFFQSGHPLPHRRKVEWLNTIIPRVEMSEGLRNSSGSIGTTSDISRYAEEIERFVEGSSIPQIISTDRDIEDPTVFALEEHLQSFLVKNWEQTILGRDYKIFEEEGQKIGVEYQTDNGRIDILEISKDKTKLLVIELKRGRASDRVVGQILNYMGYISEEVAENSQVVKGCIIALEDDQKIKNALKMVNGIEFYKYEINFNLSIVNT